MLDLHKHAIISLIRIIGEYSKYTYTSRNLTYAIRSTMPHVPWNTLSSLRDKICKHITKGKQRGVYSSLIQKGDNYFSNLQSAIVKLFDEFKSAKDQLLQLIQDKDSLIAFYSSNNVRGSFLNGEQQNLLRDILYVKSTRLIDAKLQCIIPKKAREVQKSVGKIIKKNDLCYHSLSSNILLHAEKEKLCNFLRTHLKALSPSTALYLTVILLKFISIYFCFTV